MSALLARARPPYQRRSIRDLMDLTLTALLPGLCALFWLYGYGLLFNLLLAVAAAVLAEALCLHLRGQSVSAGLKDHSALVTALLLALCLPPGLPWWLPVAGVIFAIVLGKQVFGGLGQNLFNPAMCGYGFVLLIAPDLLRQASLPDAGLWSWQGLQQAFSTTFPAADRVIADGVSMATPLGSPESELPGAWLWPAGLFLLGGLYLLSMRVIHWQIPIGVLSGLAIVIAIDCAGSGIAEQQLRLQFLSLSTVLAAFFIATDPVTSPDTSWGRLIYGLVIGITVALLRSADAAVDAFAFAILFANFLSPLLDLICQRRILGHLPPNKRADYAEASHE